MRILSALEAVQGDACTSRDDAGRRARPSPTRSPPHADDRGLRRPERDAPLGAAAKVVGADLSAGPAARAATRPRRRAPRFQRRDAFLVHQCARSDRRRTGAATGRGLAALSRRAWIVALHHHLVEYPRPVAAFSERIGTALINGSWFVRGLEAYAAGLSSCTAIGTSTGSACAATWPLSRRRRR